MDAGFARGSEWRRWDLHVHTPASVLENNFPGWDEYVDELEKRGTGVAVIGVTDYSSIDGYKKLLDYKDKGKLKDFQLLIPNIEFRTQPPTSTGRSINVHLLISPHDHDHIERIDAALAQLIWVYDDTKYPCTRDGLIKLGRAQDPTKFDPDAAYRFGALTFKPNYADIKNWVDGDAWLKHNSIVVVSSKSDGTGGLTGGPEESGFSGVREEILRMSKAVFSANPTDRKFFLGKGADSPSEVIRKCGSLKPCIHGCDAHNLEKLFKPDMTRYCWIKADPTFEGLRQICHEPDERVHIGETPPTAFDASKIIDSVNLDFPAVFASPIIKLNPGLVAVIGEKGSGKTALAELIAFACGAYSTSDSSTSFIQRAGPKITATQIKVNWGDSKVSTATLSATPNVPVPLVRYLSQDFVERLCSVDLSGAELVKEIEGVVFSHLSEADTLDASSFEDLRRLKTATIISRRNAIGAQINELNAQLDQLQNVVDELPRKQASLDNVVADIGSIDKQLPDIESGVNQAIAQKLAAENEILGGLNSQLSGINRRRANVQTARDELHDYEETVKHSFEHVSKSLLDVGVPVDVVNASKPTFSTTIREVLGRIDDGLSTQATNVAGDENNVEDNGSSIADVKNRIGKLQKELASDAQVRERLIALQTQRSRLVADKARIEREIDDIKGKHSTAFANKFEDVNGD
jgi:predicted  nucleic acid-binding Zn-ribbon protein